MSRPALTILLLTRNRLVRADFHGNTPKLSQLWEAPPPDTDDLLMLTETAISLGPKLAPKVWVLCSDLWTQTLSVGTNTANLSSEDLSQALSYEAEAYSGIAGFESVLGVKTIQQTREQQTYWITQIRRENLEGIAEVIRKAGSKLAGICHPAGLPSPLISGDQAPWQRTELWPDTIICVNKEPATAPRILVINSDPAQHQWRYEKESWEKTQNPVQHREMMLTSGEMVSLDEFGQPQPALDDAETSSQWLTLWAKHLSRKTKDVPVLHPEEQPLTSGTRFAIGFFLFMVVAGACVAHHLYIKQFLLPAAQKDLADIKQKISRGTSLKKRKTALTKQHQELIEGIEKLEGKIRLSENALLAHQKRLGMLLHCLAEEQPEHLFVQKILAESGNTVLHGLALEEQLTYQYASRLDLQLRSLNWQVSLHKLTRSEDNGLYQFEIHLQDLVDQEQPSALAKSIPVSPNKYRP